MERQTSTRDRKGVQSVARALDVLSCFTPSTPEWGVSEMAQYLGIYKSSAHRFFRTLEEAGYVEKTASHRYQLGIRSLELGNTYRLQSRLVQAAEEPLHLLTEQLGFSSHLAQLDGRDALELLRIVSKNAELRPRVIRKSAHASAAGKVLLAFSGDQVVDRFIGMRLMLQRYTPTTITDPVTFRDHLKCVRNKSFALDLKESFPWRICMAVPVFARSGQLVASLSVSGSPSTLEEKERGEVLPELLRTATRIQQQLV